MSKKSVRKKAAKSAKQAEYEEHERRWGIQDDGSDEFHRGPDGSFHAKVRLIPMIIDVERSYHDGNFTLVSNEVNQWMFEQPESRVPGVAEAVKVAMMLHRNGLACGVGSPEHAHAVNAMTRFRENSTKSERLRAVNASGELLARFRETFNYDLLNAPFEPAATPDEVIDFYAQLSGGIPALVQ